MYLDEDGKLITSNGIVFIDWKPGIISRIVNDCSWQDEEADYALGWDPITKEYKCYARPKTNNGPGYHSNNYDTDRKVYENRGLKALSYGNTVTYEKMVEVFSEIEFVEDYLESGGGIYERCPEYFI